MRKPSTLSLSKLWERIRYSYWFVPSLMTVAALVLAVALLEFERAEEDGLIKELGWIYAGEAEGAREVLSVIAGSMITVAGVVFSITVVALTLASSQFGPRVLRNFMRDRGNQLVLGTFIATFVYCLFILRTIHGGDEAFVPQLSVTVAVGLALASLGVLIYFIHHAAISIQAAHIVTSIGHELYESIDRLYPEALGAPRPEHPDGGPVPRLPEHFEEQACPVMIEETGYLQAIDQELLLKVAVEADVVLRLQCRPGGFISPYKPLLLVWPERHLDPALRDRLREAFALGKERTHIQDVLFAVDQLVEVAVRALSPGINDPFTAMRCLDWLGAGLARRLGRSTPSAYREDEAGRLRVITEAVTFEEMVDAAFSQIRVYGQRNAAVMNRLLEVLRDVAPHARTPEARAVLLNHAHKVLNDGQALSNEEDRTLVETRYREVLRVL